MATGRDDAQARLGAHVSSAGGVERAPARGAALGIHVIQIFTKPVQRWAEREVSPTTVRAFAEERRRHSIHIAGSHDSYLINLASPSPELRDRSLDAFRRELARCDALGLDFLVTHPGNATDGDRDRGLRRNAEGLRRALSETAGSVPILLEITAGQGTALGCNFEELARLIEAVGPEHAGRMGVCLDTAHLHAAGYDLIDRYDEVFEELDRLLGLERVRLFHLNDSRGALGSRIDRHEHIGRGELGPAPFRRLMNDPRFSHLPRIIETPKDDDALRSDRRNLRWLRRCRRSEAS